MSGTVYVGPVGEGRWRASLVELPGCMAVAETRDAAVDGVRAAFPQYVALLEQHGARLEHARGLDPATFEVKDAPEAHVYPEDFRGMEEHAVRDFLHQYEALHAALLEEIRGLTQEELERAPREGEWSVREALLHVATGSLEILARLEPWPGGDFATLNATHRLVFQRFAIMDAADTQREHRVLGRRWSAAKVARRLLEHEYEHLRQVRETIEKLSLKA